MAYMVGTTVGRACMRFERETEYDEFKTSLRELNDGIQSMAAIMNKGGSGTIWFGVRPDGMAVGMDVTEKTLRDVSQAIGNQIRPRIYPSVTSVPIHDGSEREVVRVRFSGDDPPYACKGIYRVRVADEDVQLEPAELRRMLAEQIRRSDPWDGRTSTKVVSDVDERTLRDYVARGNACGRIPDPFTTSEEALESLGLLREGHLTNAADVLFCKSKGIRLKQGVLESHTRTEILDLQQEEGTVFDLVRKADLYILNNTRRRLVIEGPGPREEIPEIPREAVREALYNAYCHMDWTVWDCVMVDIYYDSVEILSPGWFVEGQDPEEHLTGKSRSPLTRNPLIAKTLYRSKEIENYGSGIPRIKELCDEAGIRVEYRRTPDGTLLVFQRRDAFAGMRRGGLPSHGEGINETVSETVNGANETVKPSRSALRDEGELLSLLVVEPGATYEALADATGFSRAKVARLLRGMRERGVIMRVGSDKRGSWRVVQGGMDG